MSKFNLYQRKQIAELRPVDEDDIKEFAALGSLTTEEGKPISISQEDLNNGSPHVGDMIARNPKNHSDQWLVAEQYFKENFEGIT